MHWPILSDKGIRLQSKAFWLGLSTVLHPWGDQGAIKLLWLKRVLKNNLCRRKILYGACTWLGDDKKLKVDKRQSSYRKCLKRPRQYITKFCLITSTHAHTVRHNKPAGCAHVPPKKLKVLKNWWEHLVPTKGSEKPLWSAKTSILPNPNVPGLQTCYFLGHHLYSFFSFIFMVIVSVLLVICRTRAVTAFWSVF